MTPTHESPTSIPKVGDAEAANVDAVNVFDDDDDLVLKWSWRYVSLCILIPSLGGFITGYCWAGLALHYQDMGWSIATMGTGSVIGFVAKIFVQKMQVRYGFWVCIPLSLAHLIATILGVIFTDQEWAVILEVAALRTFDLAITNEGLAFEAFGRSEDLARQASSTVLAIYSICVALGCPVGAALYDYLGKWRANSVFHLVCQGLLLILFSTEPGVIGSFKELFFQDKAEKTPEDLGPSQISVVPNSADGTMDGTKPAKYPVDLLTLEDLEEDTEEDLKNVDLPGQVPSTEQTETAERPLEDSPGANGPNESSGQRERATTYSRTSKRERGTTYSCTDLLPERQSYRVSRVSQGTRNTTRSSRTRVTVVTHGTARTNGTGRSGLSRLANLGESDHFLFSAAVVGNLDTQIAPRLGTARENEEEEEEVCKSIPKDVRLPALMISLCCFNTAFCYFIELGTFVLLFKDYHQWDSAFWIGIVQCAGDLGAGMFMQAIPTRCFEADPTKVGFFGRIFMQPYNVSWLLILWVLCNLGMASPWLVAAVIACVGMGSVFVYNAKFTQDLNLFFSLGDNGVFMTLQVWCKNAFAIGGCISSLLGPVIYSEVSPVAPYLLSTAVSLVTYVAFTGYFLWRVGLLEIENAEARRSRRLGSKRISSWKVQRTTTKELALEDE